MPARILVGTASWSDPGFVKHWYPKKMPAGDLLAWYAQHFEMVEVNSTFYSAPDPRMVERWCRNTPDGFIFDVKPVQDAMKQGRQYDSGCADKHHTAEQCINGRKQLGGIIRQRINRPHAT